MEHYATRVLRLQLKHLIEMPCYGLPFAVFIGSEPYGLRALCRRLQLAHQIFLLGGNLIVRSEIGIDVDAEVLLPQVADMTVARHDFEVRAQEFLDGFRLCGRLDYDQVFHLPC